MQLRSGMRIAAAISPGSLQGQLWAARECDPSWLGFNGFGDGESILELGASGTQLYCPSWCGRARAEQREGCLSSCRFEQ